MTSLPKVAGLALLVVVSAACGGGRSATRVPASTSPASLPPTSKGAVAARTTTTTAPPAEWRAGAAAPTARQEVASTVLDDRVWVIGGLTAAGASAVVESYNPATDRWSPEPPLPIAVHHAAATVYRGEIVVAGGFLAGADLYARPTDRVLVLRSGAWTDMPRLRRPRGAAAAGGVGDTLVVAGGRDDGSLIGPTEVFDGARWKDGEALPTRRDHLSAVSDGRSLYTVGGRFLSPGAISAAFERYDPVTGAWERLPALPTARSGQGAALAEGRVIVAGGEAPSGVFAEVEAYDIAHQAWAALPPLPTPRHGLALERVGARILALVGGTVFGVAPSSRAEVLGPVS